MLTGITLTLEVKIEIKLTLLLDHKFMVSDSVFPQVQEDQFSPLSTNKMNSRVSKSLLFLLSSTQFMEQMPLTTDSLLKIFLILTVDFMLQLTLPNTISELSLIRLQDIMFFKKKFHQLNTSFMV